MQPLHGNLSALKANVRILASYPTALLPMFAGLAYLLFALALSTVLHLSDMELPGIEAWSVPAQIGSPREQIHRLLWGSSVLALGSSFVVSAAVAVVQIRKVASDRPSWTAASLTPIPAVVSIAIIAAVTFGPASEIAPGTLGRFHELLQEEKGIASSRLTAVGNAWVAFTCVLVAFSLVYLLIPPDRPSVGDLQRRAEGVRSLFFVSSIVFVLGLIEISLLHSWPSTIVDAISAHQIRAMSIATAVVGGVFFGVLLLAFYGTAALILRRQVQQLASKELGDSTSAVFRRRWIEDAGLSTTSWQRAWNAIGILAPILSATSVTTLVQAVASAVGQ